MPNALASEQVAAVLDVDVRLLIAFPTARGLARHMRQADRHARHSSAAPGQVEFSQSIVTVF